MALRGHNLPVLGSPAAGTSCWPDPVRCIDILCRCERVQDELDRFNTDIKILNQDYAAGINRPQWHGTPYKVTFNGANSAWPGWEFQHGSPLGWGAFDPRQAYWGDVQELTNYVSRTQTVLQTGVAKADLLVLRGTNQSFSAPSSSSNSLQTLMNAGWTYQLGDDRMLTTPNAVVQDGMLDPYGPTNGVKDGPAYKAVVVSGATELKVATVNKLIEYCLLYTSPSPRDS